jgi:hypothetical protein
MNIVQMNEQRLDKERVMGKRRVYKLVIVAAILMSLSLSTESTAALVVKTTDTWHSYEGGDDPKIETKYEATSTSNLPPVSPAILVTPSHAATFIFSCNYKNGHTSPPSSVKLFCNGSALNINSGSIDCDKNQLLVKVGSSKSGDSTLEPTFGGIYCKDIGAEENPSTATYHTHVYTQGCSGSTEGDYTLTCAQ